MMTVCLRPVKYRQLQQQAILLFKNFGIRSVCCNSTGKLIKDYTELTRDHMTPEIALHLITRNCKLWHEKGDNSPFADPFWAFYWPGGQVLTRYILDNPEVFQGKSVLDVGSGCGASAIAAKMVGARIVLANDTDPVSITAINMNAMVNGVSLETSAINLIGQLDFDWSTILLGDMFYDDNFRDSLVSWLTKQCAQYKTTVFIGDPGRLPLTNHPIKDRLKKVAEYELPINCWQENNGFSTGYVWKLVS